MARHIRNTMGQDWGGRRADNPKGSWRVTAQQVRKAADAIGIKVKREHPGPWSQWLHLRQDGWYNLGTTNLLALERLSPGGDLHAEHASRAKPA